jgi:hypothetical protein
MSMHHITKAGDTTALNVTGLLGWKRTSEGMLKQQRLIDRRSSNVAARIHLVAKIIFSNILNGRSPAILLYLLFARADIE